MLSTGAFGISTSTWLSATPLREKVLKLVYKSGKQYLIKTSLIAPENFADFI